MRCAEERTYMSGHVHATDVTWGRTAESMLQSKHMYKTKHMVDWTIRDVEHWSVTRMVNTTGPCIFAQNVGILGKARCVIEESPVLLRSLLCY